ncbi:HAMP domain-containing histidine kinase [Paenisporosarcina sp. OV554]|uniref:HAMP domain-containing sensor histidine kinase n=1 Tax=Paenisporosarcina sp. OV554 TaxID=2135694 RepID=UPI000D4F7280|nr:HAMP domain-containing histidine kinase [Paenisporosarcina sp. OV554]PUB13942.1 two-component system sensor histidine kinase ArlS [Paenisporosarcina sp. OV554]
MTRMNQWNQSIASQSLKKKWAISSGAVIFISFAVMSIILYIALKGWLYQQEEQEVNRTMSDLTSFFESQGPFLTVQDIQSNKGLMTSIIDKDQTVRLLNADGIELLQINNTSTFPAFDEIDLPDNGYSLDTDKSSSISAIGNIQLGKFIGYVQLEHPLKGFQSMMNYILTAMLLFSVCSLLLSGWIGYILATYLLRPLKDLKLSMDDVAAHGFEKDLSIDYHAKDEIGELITVYESMMGKLKSSFEQQQQFMADASHELRTPIQVVEGHLALLNRWGKDDPVILKESLEISLHEVNQMKSLIDEMLELARGEQMKDRPPTNIVKHTKEVIEEIIQVHPTVQINHNLPIQEVLNVQISSNAYHQIIRNILTNAIRYSKEPAHVSISYEIKPEKVIVLIQDEGIGISPKDQSKIFDRFYRVDAARSRDLGGSGLGLSIVKMLMENARGTIFVASETDKGSTFSMVFPLIK